jgi:hypothetical protein
MPFTPSHVAAALPFLRTPLLPAAVVVGTMAPDVPYYVPLFVHRDLSHSLLGLVTIDLLIGVVGALLWWFVAREPVIDVLPRAIGARIPALPRDGWRPGAWGWTFTAGVLVLSALVGAATHLLWDSFTHPGWLVDHVAVLRLQLGPLPLNKWLQHLSSLGGLVILAIWAVRHLRRVEPDAGRPTRFVTATRVGAWVLIVVAGLVAALVTWIGGMAGGMRPFDPSLVFAVARYGIALAGAATVVVVAIWTFALRRDPRDGSR